MFLYALNHEMPFRWTAKYPEWHRDLLAKVSRCDKSFNPEKAHVCSRHFEDNCFKLGMFSRIHYDMFGHLAGYVFIVI